MKKNKQVRQNGLPTGKKMALDLSVVSLILEENGKLLLLKKAEKRGGEYTLVGGRVEKGESVLQALVRECREEVGIDINPADAHLVHVVHRRRQGQAIFHFFFYATIFVGTPDNCEPSKCSFLHWYDANALPEPLLPAIKQGIAAFQQNLLYSERGWTKFMK